MIKAVLFDWGGTLTLPLEEALYDDAVWDAAAGHMSPERAVELARHLRTLEEDVWELARTAHSSGRLSDLLRSAAEEFRLELAETAVEETAALHLETLKTAVIHDPDAAAVLTELRRRGLKLGLLSNTIWPQEFHEDLLARDGLLDLLDVRVYSSDLPVTKPHPDAFMGVLHALGETDPASAVFVGDRPWDDIYGASRAGLRTVLRPNPRVPAHDIEPTATISRLPELLRVIEGWESDA